ncbi:hypothetical protein [Streptomyces sp. NRRL S-87]|uniref:hypothetical protein n=1 Tax=Streptomyces sp. NRRL S-87 TaxID=1463920 RepID=UPI000A6D3D0E|nr:hypothetical protein [Streptomyces sp. NRRL S-87]
MATSRGTSGGRPNRALAYLESKKNLAGSACGIAGVVLTFTGTAGTYWPLVVAGLYGAGALLAPPEPLPLPDLPDPSEQLGTLREDFTKLRDYLTSSVDLPPAAGGKLAELLSLYGALLDPGWVADLLATDPDSVHTLSRAVCQDLPESLDAYHRTRWWTRLNPGTEPPERHLERQLGLLHDEAGRLARELREVESRRQQTHTTYLEDRGRS